MGAVFHCPACGADASLDVIIAHDEARHLVAEVVALSVPLGGLVERYLRLFKPPKQVLRAQRYHALLAELLPDLRRQAITRKGREWHVPLDTWKLALEAVFAAHLQGRLDLPLTDHGYLNEVLMRMADKHESRAEREREHGRRQGRHDQVDAAEAAPVPVAPLTVPPPQGPSLYARKLHAQRAAQQALQDPSNELSNREEKPS